jgi:hypothetical protein
MRKVFAILIGAVLLGAAFAVEFPAEGDVVLTAEGSVVGTGEFQEGDLDLELLSGFSGFATMTVVDEAGNEISVEVFIDSDASVVLSETLEDLRDVVAETGGEVTVTVEESLEVSGNMAFGAAVPDHVTLPGVAKEGMARAEENHAEAKTRTGDGQGASAETRVRGEGGAAAGRDSDDEEERGGAEAEAEAEVEVGVGVGSGR